MKTIVYPVWQKEIYRELAVMELDRQNLPKTEKNIEDLIQEFARESLHSFKPNPKRKNFGIAGNPTPTMSEDVFVLSSPHIFGPDGILRRYSDNEAEFQKHLKRYKAIIMSLTAFYMDLIMNVRREQKGKDLTDRSNVSPFQYMKKSGAKATDEEKAQFRSAELMRYHRILVETVAAMSLKPFFEMKPEEIRDVIVMSKLHEQSLAVLKRRETRHKFVKAVTGLMGKVFGNLRIITILKG